MSIATLVSRIDEARGGVQRARETLSGARGKAKPAEETSPQKQGGMSASDIGHTVLDVAGLIPVVGTAADLVNAGWYAAEGDYVNAGLSALGAIPGIGDAATATKLGVKGADAAIGAAKAADDVADGAKSGSQSLREISGQRRPISTPISNTQETQLRQEFAEVGGKPEDFIVNQSKGTHYDEVADKVNVGGNVFPNEYSDHPRSAMSSKAALAHELGHQAYRGTKMEPGDWRDEFRASYHAARHAPSLSDTERADLVQDAISRAQEAGAPIRPLKNKFIRETLGLDYQ